MYCGVFMEPLKITDVLMQRCQDCLIEAVIVFIRVLIYTLDFSNKIFSMTSPSCQHLSRHFLDFLLLGYLVLSGEPGIRSLGIFFLPFLFSSSILRSTLGPLISKACSASNTLLYVCNLSLISIEMKNKRKKHKQSKSIRSK